jgi:hypothetical protein
MLFLHIAFNDSEAWVPRKLDRKHLESFKMWCWIRIKKIKWQENVTNEDVLESIEEKKTILNNILCRKANCIKPWLLSVLDTVEHSLLEHPFQAVT